MRRATILGAAAAMTAALVPATASAATVQVNASSVNDTPAGVTLAPGEQAVLTATATNVDCGNLNTPSQCPAGTGPDGVSQTGAQLGGGFAADNLRAYSLIGRLDNGPYFFIGAGPTTVTGPGNLKLKYNDDLYFDNSGFFTVTITRDTTPPETTITSGPTGVFRDTTTNDSTPTFTFTSSESPSTFKCTVDNGPVDPCSSPYTTAPLADGTHTLRVAAVDAAGNEDPTPATSTFTVAPRCTLLSVRLSLLGAPIAVCLLEERQ